MCRHHDPVIQTLVVDVDPDALQRFAEIIAQLPEVEQRPQDSHPVGNIFYFFQLLKVCALH